jgi:hypothetical protein
VAPGFGNSVITLTAGSTTIASANREDQAALCTGPGDVRELDYTLEVDRTTIAPGTVLEAQVSIYWSNTDDSVQQNGFV